MSDIMSNSQDFSEAGTFSGRKSPEKSNFQQTCNLLSQYLKEKRSFGDLSLGMTSNLEVKGKREALRPATMDLLGKIEKSGDASDRNAKSMDLFPQHGGFGPATEDARKSTDTRPPTETETSPLTIFYGGRMFVFNDFPAAKAKDLMLMANKGLFPNTGNGVASVSGIRVGNRRPQHDTAFSEVSAAGNGMQQDRPPRTPQADVIDLPIARKVSLHRFLEKRKERISAKAPYQSRKDSATPANPPQTETKSWLGLAPQTN